MRYADDCNIYVRSRRAGERVMQSITRFITGKLKLKVNESKSAVARPAERKFLGFSFTSGRQPKRRIAPKSLLRFKKRIRELTKRNRGVSLERMVEQLRPYLTGWRGYFGFCQTPSVLEDLDSWIRRRLRCFQWKQWKRGTTRFAELRKRGVGKDLAAQTAGSSTRPVAHQPQSGPEHRLAERLLRLAWTSETQRNQKRLTNRTAVVRTRMPGGVTGTAREGLPMSIDNAPAPSNDRARQCVDYAVLMGQQC